MNREEHLQKTFPTEDGKTYIQSLDEFNSRIMINNEVSPCMKYRGVHLQQQNGYQKPFFKLLSSLKPKRILEIGTGVGGFTLFLRDTLNEIGLSDSIIKTYDIYNLSNQFNEEHDLNNIEFSNENIFNADYDLEQIEMIKSFIQSDGTTLVLCDGYNKIKEFNQLGKLLKIGDVIMAHDYVVNHQVFENDYFEKIWNWCEIIEEDIIETILNENLVELMKEDFEKIVWVCKIKT